MERQLLVAHLVMVGALAIMLFFADTTQTRIVQTSVLISVVVIAALQRMGYLTLARLLTPVCLLPLLLYTIFSGFGVHSLGITALIAMILLAAMFGGTGSIIVYCLLSLATALLAYYGEHSGLILTPYGPSPISDLVGVIILLILPSIFLWHVIRAREEDQNELLQNTERLRLLAENSRDFIWTSDLRFRFIYCSPSCEKLTGYTPEQLITMPVLSLVPEEEAQQINQQLEKELSGARRSEERGAMIVSTLETKDGETRWVETSLGLMFGENEQPVGLVGATRDVTERVELEDRQAETFSQLRQAQRMESVGQLAGGIAHDFNNLLLAIHGYGELIRYAQSKEDIDSYVRELLAASERASSLTKQLLVFSRQQAMEVQPVDLLELVSDMTTLVSRLVPASISLHIESEAGKYPIAGDVGQLEQVIMNLCVNSRDAIEGSGDIVISLTNEHLMAHANLPRGEYVRLDIRDNGVGISGPVLERIFDPFFTTKPVGEGTGLGMSVVHGIVKEHGGWIDVKSQVGDGTTVSIWLPKRSEADMGGPLDKEELSLDGEGQTILVVDDDAQVRSVVARLLTMAGYNIIEASNGSEGLETMRQRGEEVVLVVSDIVMPEMSGREFAEQLRQKGLTAPIVFMSGYRGEDRDFSNDYPFLTKPFSANELLRVVAQQFQSP